MSSGQTVVIVDGPPETAQVLQAVFEPRGHRVERIRSHAIPGQPPAGNRVLVLHDSPEGARRSSYGNSPRVIIGSLTDEVAEPSATCLSPMFHFADLVRAVEGLLHEQNPRAPRATSC